MNTAVVAVEACETPVDSARWMRFATAVPGGCFSQTPAWSRICEEAFEGCHAAARAYRFTDGTEALLPGTVTTSGLGRSSFHSVRPADYGGLLSSDPLGPEHLSAVARDVRSAGFSRVVLYGSPFRPIEGPVPHGFRSIDEHTHAVPLEGADSWESIFGRTARRDVRRAQRKGVEVRVGTSAAAVDELYRLYLLSAERWGSNVTWLRPKRLAEVAVALGGDNVRLSLAVVDDRAVAGCLDYLFGDVWVAGWRAFDDEYSALHPNLLLVAEAIDEAIRRGFSWYDLGSSAGLSGVAEFKERCGAIPLGYRILTWEHPVHAIIGLGRRRLAHARTGLRAVPRP